MLSRCSGSGSLNEFPRSEQVNGVFEATRRKLALVQFPSRRKIRFLRPFSCPKSQYSTSFVNLLHRVHFYGECATVTEAPCDADPTVELVQRRDVTREASM